MGLFSRIGRLFRGFLSIFISGLEEDNPELLLEDAKQEFREKMARYNQALARLAGIGERLKLQIKDKTAKVKVLEQRVMVNHKAGNAELAGALARELQELKMDLQHDAEEYKDTESAYEANIKNAKLVQKEFEAKVVRLERQISQVKVKEAQAESAAALSGVVFKTGDISDTMKNIEEALGRKYEKTAGAMRVATDMADTEGVNLKEAERKALEQQALADFLSQQGVQAEAKDQQVPPKQKEIGPQQ